MKIKILIALLIITLVYGCDEDVKGPLVTNSYIPPEVTDIKIENMPGGAKITYNIPENSNILYVLARFQSRNDTYREVKSSIYKNFIILEGFPDTREYPVYLHSVSRSEVRSNGVMTTINPLKPPIESIFETLTIHATFGGVIVSFYNEYLNEYILHTLVKSREAAEEEWIEYDRLYTQSQERVYAVRGLEAVPTDFAFYFTDKWKNNSDTLEITLTPLYETICDKSLWKNVGLSDDSDKGMYLPDWDISNLWDGGSKFFYQHDNIYTVPNWITIDLGKKYTFSRMRVNQLTHHDTWKFGDGAPQIFEIWATNAPSTDWEVWTLLGKFESIKPSGLPVGQFTEEDYAVNMAGEDFDFPPMSDAFQYIRFKTLKTWGNTRYVCFKELTLWGQEID